jgi:hypothetical protein
LSRLCSQYRLRAQRAGRQESFLWLKQAPVQRAATRFCETAGLRQAAVTAGRTAIRKHRRDKCATKTKTGQLAERADYTQYIPVTWAAESPQKTKAEDPSPAASRRPLPAGAARLGWFPQELEEKPNKPRPAPAGRGRREAAGEGSLSFCLCSSLLSCWSLLPRSATLIGGLRVSVYPSAFRASERAETSDSSSADTSQQ